MQEITTQGNHLSDELTLNSALHAVSMDICGEVGRHLI
jgi:hypothetical protein